MTWLNELGYGVTVVDDNELDLGELDAADLVVISSTVTPALIPAGIANTLAPVLSNESLVAPKLGFGTPGVDITGQTKINVVDPASPLAVGFSGTTVVGASAPFSGVKNTGAGVDVVARAATQPAVATIVSVDAGETLTTGVTPNRRVGFFLGSGAPLKVNATGRIMFDAAVVWLTEAPQVFEWWNSEWQFREQVALNPGVARTDAIVEADLDLTSAATSAGQPVSTDSFRVVEIGPSGAVIAEEIPFQFDPAADFDPSSAVRGHLTILAPGATAAGAQRRFHLYFDTVDAGHPAIPVTPLVGVEADIPDQGQNGFRITLADSTWNYQNQGGGFSSLVDQNGNDWLSYSTATGSAGAFRGMPNAVHPEGHFHPGATSSTTTLVSSGPLRAVIESAATGGWLARWEFFPDHARMTMVASPATYWFLYEGTPGGSINANDTVLRPGPTPGSPPVSNPGTGSWTEDLLNPEWVAFRDSGVGRSLVVAHLTPDSGLDSYRLMQNNMTVFGFGRDMLNTNLSGQHQFVVGFEQSTDTAIVAAAGLAAATPITSSYGAVESYPG